MVSFLDAMEGNETSGSGSDADEETLALTVQESEACDGLAVTAALPMDAPLAIEVPAMALGLTNASSGAALANLTMPAFNLSSGSAMAVEMLVVLADPGEDLLEDAVQALIDDESLFLDACLTGGLAGRASTLAACIADVPLLDANSSDADTGSNSSGNSSINLVTVSSSGKAQIGVDAEVSFSAAVDFSLQTVALYATYFSSEQEQLKSRDFFSCKKGTPSSRWWTSTP